MMGRFTKNTKSWREINCDTHNIDDDNKGFGIPNLSYET